jgi:cyanophycinase
MEDRERHPIRPESPDKKLGLRVVVGGSTPQSVMERFTHAVPDGADISVITVATMNGPKTFQECEESFRKSGFEDAIHHISRESTPKEARKKLRTSGGIYISGGNQGYARLYLQQMEIDTEIGAKNKEGAAVAVNSAGAALAGEEALVPSRLVITEEEVPIDVVPGLGVVEGVLFDTHFSERERIHRLWPYVEDTGLLGVGIDEGTATLIDADGKVEVAGRRRGTVTVLIPTNGRSYEPKIFNKGESFELAEYMPLIKPHVVFHNKIVA